MGIDLKLGNPLIQLLHTCGIEGNRSADNAPFSIGSAEGFGKIKCGWSKGIVWSNNGSPESPEVLSTYTIRASCGRYHVNICAD
jgi:hypothetical protein